MKSHFLANALLLAAAAAQAASQGANYRALLRNGELEIAVEEGASGRLSLKSASWEAFLLESLAPVLYIDGVELRPASCEVHAGQDSCQLSYTFGQNAVLTFEIEAVGVAGLRLRPTLRNTGGAAVLNRVALLENTGDGGTISFAKRFEAVRVLEQGNYWGRVSPLVTPTRAAVEGSGEPAGAIEAQHHASDFFSVVYDREARRSFLAGFETSERWIGRIELSADSTGVVTHWRAGFDGGDLRVDPNEAISLEPLLFLEGSDPWALMETYADLVRDRFPVSLPEQPPVSWCSWYPYRLGVTEDRILETARIGAQRLKPLGLRIIELDLGWEKDQLPSTFEENDQFPHGLGWLSVELAKLGFDLGVWKAPFTISEFDPVAREHPEWLIRDELGAPKSYWEWFWQPHGNVYILDLTHPGAQEWLREKASSLHERGVRYLKSDFIGCVSHDFAKRRHDPKIVAGGGVEAARIGARIIRKSLPDALLLNCGGPEMPGTGAWPLLYTCNDTGNTGFIGSAAQRENYLTVACHLFKNRRWGIIQPSCLCVGLPGTIEDARLRATAAFLAGGQIDISDTLTTLPEDRWAILEATLPPLGISARPVDLFDPIRGTTSYAYSAVCQNGPQDDGLQELPPGSAWHLHVQSDWDAWDLVGIFSFEGGTPAEPSVSRFVVPLTRIGRASGESCWAYEFWDGQFLGQIPGKRSNPKDYTHPGDFQDLAVGNAPDTLDVAFFGPGVKLICLRTPRPHPWVVGSTFHQSCGVELRGVTWDAASNTLRGEVHRPRGETGCIVFVDGGRKTRAAEVDGQAAALHRGSNGAWVLPVILKDTPAVWRITFERE